MGLSGIFSSEQLAVLDQALDDFCRRRGLVSPTDRENVAQLAMALYTRGSVTRDELVQSLEEQSRLLPQRRQA